jgi:O-acetyl-ADP-ribose deacetylase (regulator of RNase III)/uncharacterized tellurite resistance protein B-like protein
MGATATFVAAEILPGLGKLLFLVISPAIRNLLKFTVYRLFEIPVYLRLLWGIYQNSAGNSESRKYVTSVLLVLGSILTFVTYSWIPMTGIPILGELVTPVAGAIAIIVSLVALDSLQFDNHSYFSQEYPQEYQRLQFDIEELARIYGQDWDKIVQETQKLLDTIKNKIDAKHDNNETILLLINGLIGYLGEFENKRSLSIDELERLIVSQSLSQNTKFSASTAQIKYLNSFLRATNTATRIFLQADLGTLVKAALGWKTSTIAGASACSGTLAMPLPAAIGMAALCHERSWQQPAKQQKLDALLVDIFMAALPMVWVDGHFSNRKRDAIKTMLENTAINRRDAKRVCEAMATSKSWETVVRQGLLKGETPENTRFKNRLLLAMTWELAIVDGSISQDEVVLHDRMAQEMGYEEREVREIRRLILCKSGIDIRERVAVVRGDLTEEAVDVIVTSANFQLTPTCELTWIPIPGDKQKVDLAVHRAAGVQLKQECSQLKHCTFGEAVITHGYKLPADWVIHTVVPTYQYGDDRERYQLAQCYHNSLQLAHKRSLSTIAIPALGTGTGNFPVEMAARVAVREIQRFLQSHFTIKKIRLVCLEIETYHTYLKVVEEIMGSRWQNLP